MTEKFKCPRCGFEQPPTNDCRECRIYIPKYLEIQNKRLGTPTDNRNWLKKMWDLITKSKCPECNKSGGQEIKRNLISTSDHIGTTMRRESHYDKNNRFTGSTYRPISVTIQTKTYNVFYRCDYCGYEWSKNKKLTSPII